MTENRYEEYFGKIYDEVSGVFDEDDEETRLRMADDVLREHPDNPFARYLKWQRMDDDDAVENVSFLASAVEALRPAITEAVSDGALDDDIRSAYVIMLSDLASFLYFSGERDTALETAREFMRLDLDYGVIGRLVYYALLIEKGLYDEAVSAADDDMCETPIAAHCRAIALYETEGPGADASDALIEAILMDPDMALYIIGFWEFEDEMDDCDEDIDMDNFIIHISMLSDLWTAADERLAFFGVVTFAFGYMTGRMDGTGDIEMLEDSYRGLGCLSEMREARDTLRAMTASGKEQDTVDEEALMMFRDMRGRGFFNL